MSKRIDNIVNELTNYIEEQMQTEVEMALGVKHRKDVGVPMFGSLCFICKDVVSADISELYKVWDDNSKRYSVPKRLFMPQHFEPST